MCLENHRDMYPWITFYHLSDCVKCTCCLWMLFEKYILSIIRITCFLRNVLESTNQCPFRSWPEIASLAAHSLEINLNLPAQRASNRKNNLKYEFKSTLIMSIMIWAYALSYRISVSLGNSHIILKGQELAKKNKHFFVLLWQILLAHIYSIDLGFLGVVKHERSPDVPKGPCHNILSHSGVLPPHRIIPHSN